MAKDDYFVLAYRILSYLYACFKAGERPDMDCISADVLHIPVGYWFNIMRSLTEEGTKPQDLRRPGHVFPLVARHGGVLVRNGHTEATVDLMRLAGLKEKCK